MKHPLTLLLAVSTLVLATLAVARAEPITQPRDEALAGYMGDLKQTLRKLGGMVEDESKMADALSECCRLQKVVIDAKNETPTTISEIEDAKKQKKAALKYREQMQELLRAFLDLETALATEDAKKAKKAMRAFDKIESAGHSEFKPREW